MVYKWDEMSIHERDMLVAKEVMEWSQEYGYFVKTEDTNFMVGWTIEKWNPSEDLLSAWSVVEKFLGYLIGRYQSTGKYRVTVYNDRPFEALARNLPEAICKAALKAVGVEII